MRLLEQGDLLAPLGELALDDPLADVFEQKAAEEGKPENVRERIVEGQLAKWRKEVALLDQPHVNGDKHDGKTIEQLREEAAARTGENIRIARFARFVVGEDA